MASKLHYYGADLCPFAQRTWITLLEKGVDYDHEEVNLVNKPAEFLKHSAPGTVPAGYHNGVDLIESIPFAFYIDEQFEGPSLQPESAINKYQLRLRLQKFSDAFIPAYFGVVRAYEKEKLPEALQKFNDVISGYEKDLKELSPQGPYFFGEQFTLLDIAVFPFFERAATLFTHYRGWQAPTSSTYPRLAQWYEATASRKSVATTRADRTEKSLRTHPYQAPDRQGYLLEVYKGYFTNTLEETKERLKHAKPPLAAN